MIKDWKGFMKMMKKRIFICFFVLVGLFLILACQPRIHKADVDQLTSCYKQCNRNVYSSSYSGGGEYSTRADTCFYCCDKILQNVLSRDRSLNDNLVNQCMAEQSNRTGYHNRTVP